MKACSLLSTIIRLTALITEFIEYMLYNLLAIINSNAIKTVDLPNDSKLYLNRNYNLSGTYYSAIEL